MSRVGELLAYVRPTRRRAARLLPGSPFMLRLQYLGGHPGIWQPERLWAGRVGDRIRLVSERGERWYDLPLDRVSYMACDGEGRVTVGYEPTPGLAATVHLKAEDPLEGRRQLLALVPQTE